MTLERTIRELKEANTIGPNKHQLKVQDFFPKIKNPKVLKHIEKFVKMSSSNHEKMLKTKVNLTKTTLMFVLLDTGEVMLGFRQVEIEILLSAIKKYF